MANEFRVRKAVIERLTLAGFLAWIVETKGIKINGSWVKNPNKGMPDIACIVPPWGFFFAIETKDPDNRDNKQHKETQDGWINRINGFGGCAFRCSDPDEVLWLIQEKIDELCARRLII